jgi:hypothetical protein
MPQKTMQTTKNAQQIAENVVIAGTEKPLELDQKIIRVENLVLTGMQEQNGVATLQLVSAENPIKTYSAYVRGGVIVAPGVLVTPKELEQQLKSGDSVSLTLFYAPKNSKLDNNKVLDEAIANESDENIKQMHRLYYSEYGKIKPSDEDIAALFASDHVDLRSQIFLLSEIEIR